MVSTRTLQDELRNNQLDRELLAEEFNFSYSKTIYLNTGSCGRKPKSVQIAQQEAYKELNNNPTLQTFLDESLHNKTKAAVADLFQIRPENLILTNNTTYGLQTIMQSFLLKQGDELVTTDHEHGSLKTIYRYLQESRGIGVNLHKYNPKHGSKPLCNGILNLVTKKTKLVIVSEIDCFSGFRPDLTQLINELAKLNVPLLVDGAHSPGHGICRPANYPMWVGSGHKWLGAPNGTGFVYVSNQYIDRLKPVCVGDHFYDFEPTNLQRYELLGTSDTTRLPGLIAAIRLYQELGANALLAAQVELVDYLRYLLNTLPNAEIHTPHHQTSEGNVQATGLVTVSFPPANVQVPDLREYLWNTEGIWIQPDFCYGDPGKGLRISCHAANTKEELNSLAEAIARVVK
jgi:selenocysteine lyase/cysteine desulfurase